MLGDLLTDDLWPMGEEVALCQPRIPFTIFDEVIQDVSDQGGVGWSLSTLRARARFFYKSGLIGAEEIEGEIALSHHYLPHLYFFSPHLGLHRTLLTIALEGGHFQQR